MDKRFSGSINLSGWNSCFKEQDREAILYIHGYNSPVEWGVKVNGALEPRMVVSGISMKPEQHELILRIEDVVWSLLWD